MSDPLSITAGVIAIAGLACASCKTLNDTIRGIKDAPKTVFDIRQDLSLVQGLLESLISTVQQDLNSPISPEQEACFKHLAQALKQCETTCSKFGKRLSQLNSQSDPDHMRKLDRGRFYFNENEISLFRAGLERDKQTLDVALGLVTLNQIREDRKTLTSLENKIIDSINGFTGQLEGLQLAVNTISECNSSVTDRNKELILPRLNEQEQMLKQSLKVCEVGLTTLSGAMGTNVKHAVALDKARLFVGNMGLAKENEVIAPSVTVEFLGARDEAKLAAGNMSADVARSFWSN